MNHNQEETKDNMEIVTSAVRSANGIFVNSNELPSNQDQTDLPHESTSNIKRDRGCMVDVDGEMKNNRSTSLQTKRARRAELLAIVRTATTIESIPMVFSFHHPNGRLPSREENDALRSLNVIVRLCTISVDGDLRFLEHHLATMIATAVRTIHSIAPYLVCHVPGVALKKVFLACYKPLDNVDELRCLVLASRLKVSVDELWKHTVSRWSKGPKEWLDPYCDTIAFFLREDSNRLGDLYRIIRLGLLSPSTAVLLVHLLSDYLVIPKIGLRSLQTLRWILINPLALIVNPNHYEAETNTTHIGHVLNGILKLFETDEIEPYERESCIDELFEGFREGMSGILEIISRSVELTMDPALTLLAFFVHHSEAVQMFVSDDTPLASGPFDRILPSLVHNESRILALHTIVATFDRSITGYRLDEDTCKARPHWRALLIHILQSTGAWTISSLPALHRLRLTCLRQLEYFLACDSDATLMVMDKSNFIYTLCTSFADFQVESLLSLRLLRGMVSEAVECPYGMVHPWVNILMETSGAIVVLEAIECQATTNKSTVSSCFIANWLHSYHQRTHDDGPTKSEKETARLCKAAVEFLKNHVYGKIRPITFHQFRCRDYQHRPFPYNRWNRTFPWPMDGWLMDREVQLDEILDLDDDDSDDDDSDDDASVAEGEDNDFSRD